VPADAPSLGLASPFPPGSLLPHETKADPSPTTTKRIAANAGRPSWSITDEYIPAHDPPAKVALEIVEAKHSPLVTHLRYDVRRPS
jgi:hypothetical protein